MNAAERRHQSERAKARAVRLLRHIYGLDDDWLTPQAIGRRARTRHPCSCMGCGHRRYWGGPTMQERRAAMTEDGTGDDELVEDEW